MKDYKAMAEKLKPLLLDYLNSIGLTKDRHTGLYFNPFYNDTKGSFSIDKNKILFKDYSSNNDGKYQGDIITAYALKNGLDTKADFKKIVDELANYFNMTFTETKNKDVKIPQQQLAQHGLTLEEQEPQKDYTEFYKQCKKELAESEEAKSYLTDIRKITEEQIKKYYIGYCKKTNEIIIPCTKFYFKERNIDDKAERKHNSYLTKGLKPTLWLSDKMKALNESDIIYVFESITDALMAESKVASVALNSTSHKDLFLDLMKQKGYKNKVVLMLDNDDGGRTTTEYLSNELDKMNISHIDYNDPNTLKYLFEIANRNDKVAEIDVETQEVKDKTRKSYTHIYDGQKDLNDYIKNYKLKDINGNDIAPTIDGILNDIDFCFSNEALIKRKKLMQKIESSSSMYITKFIDNIEKSNLYEPISTNINPLDEALSGGLYVKQLVVLVAETSLGKTAFALQLADTIAQTQPVLYFSLEMNRDELLARSLSRTLYQKIKNIDFNGQNFNLTALDILKGKYKNNISLNNYFNEAIAEYKSNVKDNLFFYECTDTEESKIESIKKRILDFIQATNQLKPVVFIDYLQFIESGLTHGTDKQDIDFIVKELKNLARQQAINIFLISSTSRAYYGKELDTGASKESGNIEYTADVLLALDLQAKADSKNFNADGNLTKDGKNALKAERAKNPRNIKLTILKNRNGRRDIAINNIVYNAMYNLYDFSKTADDDGWQSIE